MSQPDPSLINRVAQWRAKIQDGTITLEEMKEAIIVLRAGRQAAATQPKSKKAASGGGRTKAAPRSADDMLSELG